MLWLTTTMVSIVWADSRTGGPPDRRIPTASPPVRQTALLDRVNALVQRIGGVPRGVVPLSKVQRCVDPAGEVAQAARRQQQRAAHRVRFERRAQTGDSRMRGDPRRGRAERIGRGGREVGHAAELEPQRDRVLDRKSTRLNSSHRTISYAVF